MFSTFPLVFSNARRVLSHCNTRLRLLYLLNKPMADEDLLKKDEKEQGKPKVVANDGKWTPRTEIK